jgi:catechol 2,3-dioxygenase-like lactoylglutathione lyase family enzyme
MDAVARLDHHVALRVSDLEAAIRFWTDGVGGRQAMAPRRLSSDYFDTIFAPGYAVTLCYVLFDAGALELFAFDEPDVPVPPGQQVHDAIMHFGITVPDVPEALRRIEEHGGRACAPVARMVGTEDAPRFVYCESPDGHVFELLETDNKGVVELLRRDSGESRY